MNTKPDKEYVAVSCGDREDTHDQVQYYTNLGFHIKSESAHIIIMERDATDEPAKPYKDHVRETKSFAKTDDFTNIPSLFSIIKSFFRKKNK